MIRKYLIIYIYKWQGLNKLPEKMLVVKHQENHTRAYLAMYQLLGM